MYCSSELTSVRVRLEDPERDEGGEGTHALDGALDPVALLVAVHEMPEEACARRSDVCTLLALALGCAGGRGGETGAEVERGGGRGRCRRRRGGREWVAREEDLHAGLDEVGRGVEAESELRRGAEVEGAGRGWRARVRELRGTERRLESSKAGLALA